MELLLGLIFASVAIVVILVLSIFRICKTKNIWKKLIFDEYGRTGLLQYLNYRRSHQKVMKDLIKIGRQNRAKLLDILPNIDEATLSKRRRNKYCDIHFMFSEGYFAPSRRYFELLFELDFDAAEKEWEELTEEQSATILEGFDNDCGLTDFKLYYKTLKSWGLDIYQIYHRVPRERRKYLAEAIETLREKLYRQQGEISEAKQKDDVTIHQWNILHGRYNAVWSNINTLDEDANAVRNSCW